MNRDQQTWLAIGVFAVLLAAMLAATSVEQWQDDPIGGAEDFDALAQDLFTDHVVALEALGILLTAAMIGALVIARPLVAGEDRDVYKPTRGHELERTQRVSEAGAVFPIDDSAVPANIAAGAGLAAGASALNTDAADGGEEE